MLNSWSLFSLIYAEQPTSTPSPLRRLRCSRSTTPPASLAATTPLATIFRSEEMLMPIRSEYSGVASSVCHRMGIFFVFMIKMWLVPFSFWFKATNYMNHNQIICVQKLCFWNNQQIMLEIIWTIPKLYVYRNYASETINKLCLKLYVHAYTCIHIHNQQIMLEIICVLEIIWLHFLIASWTTGM